MVAYQAKQPLMASDEKLMGKINKQFIFAFDKSLKLLR